MIAYDFYEKDLITQNEETSRQLLMSESRIDFMAFFRGPLLGLLIGYSVSIIVFLIHIILHSILYWIIVNQFQLILQILL